MKYSKFAVAPLLILALGACTPGPAGPTGATGNTGNQGNQGNTGSTGTTCRQLQAHDSGS